MRISRRKTTVILASALIAGGIAAPAVALGDNGSRSSSSSSSRLDAVGLTEGGTKLVSFRTNDPRNTRDVGRVALAGANGDTRLVGIDHRVQNGKLYGVGDQGGIYVFERGSANGTLVGDLDPALEGRSFGVDFNPAANALRVVSDTGQNLRQPFTTAAAGDQDTPDVPDEATVVDGRLNYPAADGARGPDAGGISAAAYTNNDLSADTGTLLFDIDTALDQLANQNPANAGTLALIGKLRVGDVDPDAGFDIYSTVRRDAAVSNQGFATLTVNGKNRLYGIDLTSGQATELGSFDRPVTDIAIPLAQR